MTEKNLENDINSQELISMLRHSQYIYFTDDSMPEYYRAACISGLNVCIDIINQYDNLLAAKNESERNN